MPNYNSKKNKHTNKKSKKKNVINSLCILNTKTIKGYIAFSQKNGKVLVSYNITGLSDGDHGFHIHEYGDLRNKCKNAGGHFNPHKKHHGSLKSKHRHVGDLGNIKSKNKKAIGSFFDKHLKLDGINSIIGRSVVVHKFKDDLGLGTNKSKQTGNAGPRIACGIIGHINKSQK